MVHPKIQLFIDEAHSHGYDCPSQSLLLFLNNLGATQTEATFVLDQGFSMNPDDSESFVLNSKIFQGEEMEDFVYQTFLYSNYNPEDPNFSYDDTKVKFPMKGRKK